jgi:hypothetical protein
MDRRTTTPPAGKPIGPSMERTATTLIAAANKPRLCGPDPRPRLDAHRSDDSKGMAMQTGLRKSGSEAERPPLVDHELTLLEMLADAIVIRLMRRDGVTRAEVLNLFMAPARERLCRAA